MMRNDHGVSELMGYAVLVAVVSIAAVGLLAGSMSSVSSTEKRMELAGSVSSLSSFADMAASAVETNNTYYAACEMGVPSGCELAVLDKHDDFRSLGIYSGPMELAFVPMGSISVRSPFRSATYEGGAVLSNDTGVVAMEKAPSVHVVGLEPGKKALYVAITSISCNTTIRREGPATLYVKCTSVKPMTWRVPDGSAVTLRVRSGDPAAWQEQLERCGFMVAFEGGEAIATIGEVSEVYVVSAEADITTAAG